jgi:hypothetical protein
MLTFEGGFGCISIARHDWLCFKHLKPPQPSDKRSPYPRRTSNPRWQLDSVGGDIFSEAELSAAFDWVPTSSYRIFPSRPAIFTLQTNAQSAHLRHILMDNQEFLEAR